jgi:hypothetical protein
MNRSVRIKQKVTDLIILAEQLTNKPELMSNWCNDLLDVKSTSPDFIVDACCLNNDSVPLQLSLTTGQKGIALRAIADPGAFYDETEARYTSSIDTLLRTIKKCKAETLLPAAEKTIHLLVPQTVEERRVYKQGFVWIGANPALPGLAFYLEMAPYNQLQGWQIAEQWLMELLPNMVEAKKIITTLSQYCKIASAGLEGSTPENTRAKIYFRLLQPTSLAVLEVPMLHCKEMTDFLTLAMGSFDVEMDGLVMSIGFNLATGKLEDAKIDLCGHCLRHSPDAWQSIIEQITNRFALASVDTNAILQTGTYSFAFIGMGLTTDLKSRLNLYIKHEVKTGVVNTLEIKNALMDAEHYLQCLQKADGSWEDYQLPVGASNQWVTAYTALALAQYGKQCNNKMAIATATKSAYWLIQNRTYTAGWGYNGQTGPDGDSTALVIALLDTLELPVAAEDRLFLSNHWQQDAGIATYDGPAAWGNAHWDVTPWGFHGMLLQHQEMYYDEFITALKKNRMANGFWRSYWWRNPYYSTWITLDVLLRLGIPEPHLSIDHTAATTLDNPFDLACYIGIENIRNPNSKNIKELLRQLLNWQSKKGCWAGSANLRVTENDCYHPWENPRGNYYIDFNNTISTATAIQVLTQVITAPASKVTPKKKPEIQFAS